MVGNEFIPPIPSDTAWSPGVLPQPGPCARSHVAYGFTVVEFHGDIDLAAVAEVQVHVDCATAGPRARVVVDLRPASFIDCSGLALLWRSRQRALERGGYMGLVCSCPQQLRVLAAGGVAVLLRPATTLLEACAEALR
jgi:anti-sigma B factor antagonist